MPGNRPALTHGVHAVPHTGAKRWIDPTGEERNTMPEGENPEPTPPKSEFQPISSQEELDRIISQRLARAVPKDYEQIKSELQALQDKDKSELEIANRAATEHLSRAEQAELRALRLEVAVAKGVPLAQAGRLVGTSREELEADADVFLADYSSPSGDGSPAKQDPKPGTNAAQQGQEALAESDEAEAWARQLFGVSGQ